MKPAAVRAFALSLPEAEERETWGEATFRVRNKIFLMMGADGKRASVKAAREEQEALLAEDPRPSSTRSTSACTVGWGS